MMRFLFYIEEFDAQSVELRIKNLAGTIPIKNAHDPANYGEAAKLAIGLLMNALKNPTAADGSRAPIGFTNLGVQ